MTAFVDTSALFALVDPDDRAHERAAAILQRIAGREELLTHQYVVVETLALAQRRLPSETVRTLVLELLPLVSVEPVDDATHSAATAALLAALPMRRSFVDLVSFAFMREQGIARAFAFDADFGKAGFETLG